MSEHDVWIKLYGWTNVWFRKINGRLIGMNEGGD